jgi:HSP20 family protein
MTLPMRRSTWPQRWHGAWPEPFAELTQLWDRMGRLFETVETGPEGWAPLAEVEETDDAYLVRAELPGVKREDIQVELSGNELCIHGEIRQEERENTLRRRTGAFCYRTILPADTDTEKVESHLTEGVLTVRLPKSAQARSRRIEVTS